MRSVPPIVSVLMPVYNGGKYLSLAIESILNQTFKNFEFIIVEDSSTDNSNEIIGSYNDNRIKLIKNKKNLGQSISMNKGLQIAMGMYIARMDQDDISLPQRLEKQVEFMKTNPNVGVCGTWVQLIGVNDGVLQLETDPKKLKIKLLTNQNLAHPSVIIRKNILEKYSLEYDPEYVIGNDYDLWFKMFNYCSFSNLPEVLLKYRTHKKQKSLTDSDRSKIESKLILGQFFQKIKFPFDKGDLDIHWKIFTGNGLDSLAIIKVFKYLNRLKQYNLGKNIFEPDTFTEFLKLNWRRFMFFQNHKLLYWLSVILFFRPVQYFKVIRNRMSLI